MPETVSTDTYVVVVRYLNSPFNQAYDFYTDIPLEFEDIVVVAAANGLGLARVVAKKKKSKYANKWVVQKVDLQEHLARGKKKKK